MNLSKVSVGGKAEGSKESEKKYKTCWKKIKNKIIVYKIDWEKNLKKKIIVGKVELEKKLEMRIYYLLYLQGVYKKITI